MAKRATDAAAAGSYLIWRWPTPVNQMKCESPSLGDKESRLDRIQSHNKAPSQCWWTVWFASPAVYLSYVFGMRLLFRSLMLRGNANASTHSELRNELDSPAAEHTITRRRRRRKKKEMYVKRKEWGRKMAADIGYRCICIYIYTGSFLSIQFFLLLLRLFVG